MSFSFRRGQFTDRGNRWKAGLREPTRTRAVRAAGRAGLGALSSSTTRRRLDDARGKLRPIPSRFHPLRSRSASTGGKLPPSFALAPNGDGHAHVLLAAVWHARAVASRILVLIAFTSFLRGVRARAFVVRGGTLDTWAYGPRVVSISESSDRCRCPETHDKKARRAADRESEHRYCNPQCFAAPSQRLGLVRQRIGRCDVILCGSSYLSFYFHSSGGFADRSTPRSSASIIEAWNAGMIAFIASVTPSRRRLIASTSSGAPQAG
jgi:hypothetical protein